jgi:transposase
MARPVEKLEVKDSERRELLRRASAPSESKRNSFRAQIILMRARGVREVTVSRRLKTTVSTVSKWSSRFSLYGLEGLNDKSGRGRKTRMDPRKIEFVITKATQPPPGRTRWSTRTMARSAGISATSVGRIWKKNEMKPHRIRTFKVSNDPKFEEKFWDVIGLYLDPPEKALVLCCDEKSQCQALERTQPCLPLGIGDIRTKTHDYIRHGTITLFAALSYVDGRVISRTEEKHTHTEWLRFLKQIDRETPSGLILHLIMDNYCTHKDENVKKWLAKHPRFKIHYTPTSSSWMNMVERFFADLTQDVVRDGSFESVSALVKDIELYMAERNLNPAPYKWKAKGEEILRKINRAKRKLAEMK